jgi:hypothetical protein
MAERLILHLANEYAARHYEYVRANEDADRLRHRWPNGMVQDIDPKLFVKTFPTLKDYLRGLRHGRKVEQRTGVYWQDTGEIHAYLPAAWHFYAMARTSLALMLGDPTVSEYKKESIREALIRDREKQLEQERLSIRSTPIPQRTGEHP